MIEISVEQKHINKGTKADIISCPINLACITKYPDAYTGTTIIFLDGKEYFLPKTAQKFIRDFDAGRPVKPFTFKLTKLCR